MNLTLKTKQMKTLSKILDKISFALYGGKSLNVCY